jgi:hypothetical protein
LVAELNLRVPSNICGVELGTEEASVGSDSAAEGMDELELDVGSDWTTGETGTSSILKLSYLDLSFLVIEVPVERGGTKSSRAEAMSISGKGVGSSRPLRREWMRNIAIANSCLSRRWSCVISERSHMRESSDMGTPERKNKFLA